MLPKPLVFSAILLAGLATTAYSATTDPVGYTTITLTPSSNGVARSSTVASFPLTDAPVFAGAVTAVGTSTLTVTGAGFGNLAPVSSFVTHVVIPHNGEAEGRVLQITGNTADTITVALPVGVTSLTNTILANDSIRIVPVNTLNKVFGTGHSNPIGQPGYLPSNWDTTGGQSGADLVYLWTGTGWTAYWNTGTMWINQNNPFSNLGNTPIFPDKPVWVARISQGEMKVVVDGSVPVSTFMQAQIPGPAVDGGNRVFTFVSNPYPKAITLNDLNLTSVEGWTGAGSSTNADIVYFWTGTGWTAYWWNNADLTSSASRFWISQNNPFSSANSTPIPVGGGVWVARRSAGAGEDSFAVVPRPYTP